VLSALLQAHGIHLNKRFGQNFICDEHAVERIAAHVDPKRGVLEIGPGVGTLTLALAKRAPKVVAVEIDERLLPILHEHFATLLHVGLMHADILKVDLETLPPRLGTPFDVFANLPYQITSPLLDQLVGARHLIHSAVLMVQKELADKLLAPVGGGQGSSLGVFLQAFAKTKRLFNVPKTVFFPRPKVDSTVFALFFLPQPRFTCDEAAFFKVVRSAFNLRRKTLRQALIQSPFLTLSALQVDQVLAKAGIDSQQRGERLTLEAFDRIARHI